MAVPWKLLFKAGTILTQAADALVWPDEAGYGSDITVPVDEVVGDPGYLRKLHLTFTRTEAGIVEDVCVVTMHFAKITAEVPTNAWVTADYTAVEARIATWWTAVKPYVHTGYTLYQARWYVTGPARPISGPPVRVTTINVPGTGTAATPPQVAISISEHVRLRKHWGRMYLPGIAQVALTTTGRISAATQSALSAATTTLYNGNRTDGIYPVVYSPAKPARTTRAGATLPPQAARAYMIEQLDVDDVFDVIRSRRYSAPTARVTTTLT